MVIAKTLLMEENKIDHRHLRSTGPLFSLSLSHQTKKKKRTLLCFSSSSSSSASFGCVYREKRKDPKIT